MRKARFQPVLDSLEGRHLATLIPPGTILPADTVAVPTVVIPPPLPESPAAAIFATVGSVIGVPTIQTVTDAVLGR